MATTSRGKQPRKGMADPTTRRPGAKASFSASASRLPSDPPAPAQGVSPPFPVHANDTGSRDVPQDLILQSLAGITGTTVALLTKAGQRYEGVMSSTSPKGDTTGVTLKDVKELSKLGTPLKDTLFIASADIEDWQFGPTDTKLPNGDAFRPDTDINKGKVSRQRELQAWQASDPPVSPGVPTANHEGAGDEITLGPRAFNNTSWDQSVEKFGVTSSFVDEEVYTTKLDRSAAAFRERERKAQRIASEIMGSTANDPHIAEEKNLGLDDSGVNEEDKHSAVVRGSNAHISPGVRKQQLQKQHQPTSAGAPATNSPPLKPDIPKVFVNSPDGTVVAQKEVLPTAESASPALSTSLVNELPADPLPAFRDFVTIERERLTQKKKALIKSEMDKRKAELLKLSQTFKLNKPIPDDLVPFLAEDEEKQREIREKATQDASSVTARTIRAVGALDASPSSLRVPQIAVSSRAAPDVTRKPISVTAAATKPPVPTSSASASKVAPKPSESGKANGKPTMFIQPIPPFRGNKTKSPSPQTNGSSSTTTVSTSPSSTNRLNVNTQSFRPNPEENAFTPGPTSSIPSTASASASTSRCVEPAESLPTAWNTSQKLGVAALPRANTRKHTHLPEPESFLHDDADDDHMTSTGDFSHEDTQQKDDAYDLDEIRCKFPGDLSMHITRDGESVHPVAAGGCADIYKGTFHVHRKEIKVAIKAIKVYSTEDNHSKKKKRLRREVKVWMKLNHTNVLSLIGTTSGFGPFPAMVCPWLENGTLTSYLECCGADLEILRILTLIHDVASGLQYLHSQSIVHGDLSGSNVLINADGRACIADFGLSMILDEIGGSTFATTSTGKPRGTLRWAAPELLDLLDSEDVNTQHTGPTMRSDIYSFGGIMLQILSGKVPYHYYSRDVQIVAAIFKGDTPARPDDPRVTDRRWGFIRRCWSPFRIILQRPSSEEIVAFLTDDLVGNS